MRYYIQIKGNFDLTVVFTGVGIPTTLREIGWPKASFAKASFSQFWSTIPSHACQRNKDMGSWDLRQWTKRSLNVVKWTLSKFKTVTEIKKMNALWNCSQKQHLCSVYFLIRFPYICFICIHHYLKCESIKYKCLTSLTCVKCGVRSTLCWKVGNISGPT